MGFEPTTRGLEVSRVTVSGGPVVFGVARRQRPFEVVPALSLELTRYYRRGSWGWNRDGQLGDGKTGDAYLKPVKVLFP